MFPQITDVINYIFGTHLSLPIQSYGFFMALSFLIGAYIIKIELMRMEKEGKIHVIHKKVRKGAPASISELIMVGVVGFLVGYKLLAIVLDYNVFSDNPQTFIFSSKGSIIGALLMMTGMVLYRYFTKKKACLEKPVWEDIEIHPYQFAGNILIVAAVSGLLGAKIFHNLENFNELIHDPINSIFSFMGLTFYGGVIVGGTTGALYARKNKIPVVELFDASAAALMLAYGIGRLGCMISGDGCWGIANLNPKPSWLTWLPDWMWAFKFPHNVIGEGIPIDPCSGKYCNVLEYPVYPTSFYDFILCGIFFLALWFIRKKVKIDGALFSIMLIIMGIQRFFMEHIRVNNKINFLGIESTQAEIISIFLILLGFFGLWFFYNKSKKNLQNSVD